MKVHCCALPSRTRGARKTDCGGLASARGPCSDFGCGGGSPPPGPSSPEPSPLLPAPSRPARPAARASVPPHASTARRRKARSQKIENTSSRSPKLGAASEGRARRGGSDGLCEGRFRHHILCPPSAPPLGAAGFISFRHPFFAARCDAIANRGVASVDRAAEIVGRVVGFVLRFMGMLAVLTTANSRCDATAQKQPKCQRGRCNREL